MLRTEQWTKTTARPTCPDSSMGEPALINGRSSIDVGRAIKLLGMVLSSRGNRPDSSVAGNGRESFTRTGSLSGKTRFPWSDCLMAVFIIGTFASIIAMMWRSYYR